MGSQDGVTYRQNDSLSVEMTDSAYYVLSDPGSWVVLEGTARGLWEELGTDRSLDEIVARLLAKYSGDSRAVSRDAWDTLREWVALGIAVETPSATKSSE